MTDIRETAKPGPTFDAESMRAILAWRKTQTRRVLSGDYSPGVQPHHIRLPYRIGAVYYARESLVRGVDHLITYRSDGLPARGVHMDVVRWPGEWMDRPTSSFAMPRWAARVWLRITDVRVQRLEEISEEDAIAEGCDWDSDFPPVDVFIGRWCSINHGGLHDGAAAWERDRNRWVAAYTFEVLKKGGLDG